MNKCKEEVEGLVLADMWQLCYRAHYNTSFSPDRRATQNVKAYSEMLEEDLAELGDNQGNYKEKFIRKLSDWMSAKGRCFSSMITGGSGFNVRRAEKANNSESNHCDNFYKWREKYFNAVKRVPTPSPEEELDAAILRLDKLIIVQQNMKDINKIVKSVLGSKKSEDASSEKLSIIFNRILEEGYSESIAKEAITPTYSRYGFPSYLLTNNNATIKRTQQKVLIMKNRISTKESFEDIIFDGGYVTIEDDRVKIFHDEKPEQLIINEIKSNGFRWSPNWKCWCRKHTGRALQVVKSLTFVK